MRAAVFNGKYLEVKDVEIPSPKDGQLLIKVGACALCRTDLHIIDGELKNPKLPLILGHQVAGKVVQESGGFKRNERVGVPWLGKSCGICRYCKEERENLCNDPTFTGYSIDGGFAEYLVADANFCFPLPNCYDDLHAAPLLCAGLIGYRAYRKVKECKNVGFYGFGAAAHLLVQLAVHEKKQIFAFTRPGDTEGQRAAKEMGAVWAGASDTLPDEKLDGAILFAPVGELYPQALKACCKGATVVSAGIHMSPIPTFSYDLLWEERTMTAVANLQRQDGWEFLQKAPKVPVKTQITVYPLAKINEAIADTRDGQINGSAVIQINQ